MLLLTRSPVDEKYILNLHRSHAMYNVHFCTITQLCNVPYLRQGIILGDAATQDFAQDGSRST